MGREVIEIKSPGRTIDHGPVSYTHLYDKVDIEVDYNVNRGGSKGNNTIQKD